MNSTRPPDELWLKPLEPQHPISWIDEAEKMTVAASEIRGRKEIGLDLETTLAAPPLLCTIQIASRQKNYIFDALAIKNLAPIFRIMEDRSTVKIIHYAPFEKGVLGNLGVKINNVFDTFEVSRRLRGKRDRYYHSLARVCRRELGRLLNKSYQKSDWTRRPLSPGQLRYAALDAEIMLPLYDIFKKESRQHDLPV